MLLDDSKLTEEQIKIRDPIEFALGKDIITGEKLTEFDKALLLAPSIAKYVPNGAEKMMKKLPDIKSKT